MSTAEQRRGYRAADPDKVNAAARRYREANREKVREQGRRHAARFRADNLDLVRARERSRVVADYGLTSDEYEAMRAAQGGVCALCSMPETATYRGSLRSLAIDHDHQTGAVRQLLCAGCNWLIGRIENNGPDFLAAAAAYLERHRKAVT